MNKLLYFGNGHTPAVFQKDTASAAVCAVNCMALSTDPYRISGPVGTARSAYAATPPAYGNSAVLKPLLCSASTKCPLVLFAFSRLASVCSAAGELGSAFDAAVPKIHVPGIIELLQNTVVSAALLKTFCPGPFLWMKSSHSIRIPCVTLRDLQSSPCALSCRPVRYVNLYVRSGHLLQFTVKTPAE